MFCTDIPNPKYLIFSDSVPSLLYYSHIPTAVIALALGLFIILKNRKDMASILLFVVALLFSIWSFLDLILWTNNDSRIIMFSWGIIRIVEALIPVFVLYFSYWLIKQKEPPYLAKLFFAALIVPILIFIPTIHFQGFDLSICEPIEGPTLKYLYFLEPFVFVSLFYFLIREILKEKGHDRRKIILISFGSLFFLLSFLGTNIIGSMTLDWKTLQYGMFGMPVFIGFLGYLIIRYQAFNIKVIAAQFLTVAVWLAVFSQFFIMQERSNQILTGITLVLVTYFGWMLFKAMSEEVKVSEELTLMSRKLAGINEKLKELDHAKSEFISIASHQLRTPLTSVKGFTSLILDNTIGRIAPKQRKAVEKIYVNNEKLVMLVEDMLNASRLEAGRLEYELEEFDVTSIVAGTVDALKLYTKSKNLYLKFKKPEEKLTALVDQRKVAEIVANLIDNATKYTQKGGVTVTVEKFQREQRIGKAENTSTTNGHWARVSVTDTGIGMAEKELESIFEKFKSGMATEMSKPDDKSTRNSQPPADEPGADNGDIKADYSTQSAGGTGLAVYISRQMAQAMGGKLYAESPGKNKGSTFILELPLVKKQK